MNKKLFILGHTKKYQPVLQWWESFISFGITFEPLDRFLNFKKVNWREFSQQSSQLVKDELILFPPFFGANNTFYTALQQVWKYITTSKRYGLAKKDVNQWLIYFEFCLSFAAPGWYQLHQSLLIHPCVSDIGSVFTQDSILKQGSRAKGVGFTSLILYYIDKPARWGSLYPKGTNYSSHVATA